MQRIFCLFVPFDGHIDLTWAGAQKRRKWVFNSLHIHMKQDFITVKIYVFYYVTDDSDSLGNKC